MKRDTLLWVLLGFLFLGGGAAVYTMTRGLRNNNPGNMRLSTDQWDGLAAVQTDPDFFQFSSSQYGIRALAKTLNTYITKYGLRTVADIISRWAPSNENDTNAYVASVASTLNVSPDQELSSADLSALTKAIIKHENGLNPYSDTEISQAVGMI